MRRAAWLAIGLVLLMVASTASAEMVSRIELSDAGALGESDLGITTGEVSPDGMDVLVGGLNVTLVFSPLTMRATEPLTLSS